MSLLAKFIGTESSIAYRKPISRLLFLRTISIAIQLLSVITTHLTFKQIDYFTHLLFIIVFEVFFHLASIFYFRRLHATNLALSIQIVADIGFLTLLLLFSGGATNAFVSLLLLPLIIAAVCLPFSWLFVCAICAVGAYSLLILKMPHHTLHHMDMQEHFVGMWINFVVSAFVVTTMIGALAKSNANKEKQMARQREEQLRSEQLMALGTAAAQVTHHLATPIANIQLLYEELLDEYGTNETLNEMAVPLKQCSEHLHYFREYASQIKQNKVKSKAVLDVFDELKHACLLHFPEQKIDYISKGVDSAKVNIDYLFLSALINLVQNAIDSNAKVKRNELSIEVTGSHKEVTFSVIDSGEGISDSMINNIGLETIQSDKGMGIALFLSNTTINKLGGRLTVANFGEFGAKASIILPKL